MTNQNLKMPNPNQQKNASEVQNLKMPNPKKPKPNLKNLALISIAALGLMFSACGKHHPQNRDELVELLRDESIKLDSIDTSKITDMSLLFADFPRDKCDKLSSDKYLAPYIQNCKNNAGKREDFSGIETWDVSNVKDMNSMFSHAKSFNQPLNKWNVSKVESMDSMFFGALSFNQPLDKWDVSEVVIMWSVFENAKSFNQNLDSWDVSGLVSEAYMSKMFDNSPLESNPPKWYKK